MEPTKNEQQNELDKISLQAWHVGYWARHADLTFSDCLGCADLDLGSQAAWIAFHEGWKDCQAELEREKFDKLFDSLSEAGFDLKK